MMPEWYEEVEAEVIPADAEVKAMRSERPARTTPREQLALRVAECRKTWGMSQRQLAEKAGTTQRVISLLEAGKYNPSLQMMESIAAALGMRLEVRLRSK